ncbi:MAG: diacylglycerol kinase [Alphaproteobacteria bacterium]|nr:diacylglycerol kinase [Alphaproteobacteria bacterium]
MKRFLFGCKHLLKAFVYSWQGGKALFKNEIAFRQDLLVFIVGLCVCFCLTLTATQRAIMVFSLFLILLMETVNSAIEAVVDRISEERHPLSGQAKDMGSFLVFLSFVNAIVVWMLILL